MREQQLKRPLPEHKGGNAGPAAGKPAAIPVVPARPNPLPTPIANPHYNAIGGEATLRLLVQRFYALMDELPQAHAIRAMHPADLSQSMERLFMFLSGWLGGPQLYVERFGHPRLRQAHMTFPIDEAARNAWMDCMTQALHEQVGDDALRAQLIAAFYKTADFLRNQSGA